MSFLASYKTRAPRNQDLPTVESSEKDDILVQKIKQFHIKAVVGSIKWNGQMKKEEDAKYEFKEVGS